MKAISRDHAVLGTGGGVVQRAYQSLSPWKVISRGLRPSYRDQITAPLLKYRQYGRVTRRNPRNPRPMATDYTDSQTQPSLPVLVSLHRHGK